MEGDDICELEGWRHIHESLWRAVPQGYTVTQSAINPPDSKLGGFSRGHGIEARPALRISFPYQREGILDN